MAQASGLRVTDLSVQIGGLKAVSHVNLRLDPGELVGLIGPNGAGKTTVFNALTGFCQPTGGHIFFNDQELTHKPPHVVAKHHLARTFQNIRLFRDLTVLDNLKIAYHKNFKYCICSGIFRTPAYRRQEEMVRKVSLEILALVGLADRADDKASNLSYGEQRKLEIARALVMEPKLLLLDEPAAGMNPAETAELVELIYKIKNDFDLSVFLIEHDMHLVMNVCERLYVLDYGVLIGEGSVQDVRNNRKVIEAYLGEDGAWQS
ncbi:MAG: ABC transporter ATP-binding protein [Bacillota bacterium]|jgi:branched-chain amino acid transport system ATP-binding protein|nr:ABC transporter ATP-binding protein [Bacillota bacterium]HHT90719.1 ABC transporter ATP-binding protein [Bacillota bacterium]